MSDSGSLVHNQAGVKSKVHLHVLSADVQILHAEGFKDTLGGSENISISKRRIQMPV